MTVPVFFDEIIFRFSRSGGAGGQNVNKVESAATGFWKPAESRHFNDEQKAMLIEKLLHRLSKEGELIIKSQVHRGQAANRDEVLKKFNAVVTKALQKKKARISTRPSKASKEKRIEEKKQRSEVKRNRNKVNW